MENSQFFKITILESLLSLTFVLIMEMFLEENFVWNQRGISNDRDAEVEGTRWMELYMDPRDGFFSKLNYSTYARVYRYALSSIGPHETEESANERLCFAAYNFFLDRGQLGYKVINGTRDVVHWPTSRSPFSQFGWYMYMLYAGCTDGREVAAVIGCLNKGKVRADIYPFRPMKRFLDFVVADSEATDEEVLALRQTGLRKYFGDSQNTGWFYEWSRIIERFTEDLFHVVDCCSFELHNPCYAIFRSSGMMPLRSTPGVFDFSEALDRALNEDRQEMAEYCRIHDLCSEPVVQDVFRPHRHLQHVENATVYRECVRMINDVCGNSGTTPLPISPACPSGLNGIPTRFRMSIPFPAMCYARFCYRTRSQRGIPLVVGMGDFDPSWQFVEKGTPRIDLEWKRIHTKDIFCDFFTGAPYNPPLPDVVRWSGNHTPTAYSDLFGFGFHEYPLFTHIPNDPLGIEDEMEEDDGNDVVVIE